MQHDQAPGTHLYCPVGHSAQDVEPTSYVPGGQVEHA